jgi:hypothetical protein
MTIANIKFDQEIPFSLEAAEAKELSRDLPDIFPIRANTILHKSKTGLGATYNEIIAPRHSIIVLPHISIIKSKQEHHKDLHDTFSVYGEKTTKQILDYLTDYGGTKKFLTTPQGVRKIIAALNMTQVSYKKAFFLLIDECHKLIQDALYRRDMIELMEIFFEFDNKAMVSATPIPPSDPRFAIQGFKHIKLYPDYDNKKNVKLIHADSIVNGLKEQVASHPSDCYCIFFNSINGISSLIDQLKLQGNYNIYCSEESRLLLNLNNERNAQSTLSHFKEYNFFTSSFFNGLDIIIKQPVTVIILSDYSYQSHTIIDPFTDTLQILGRFRNEGQSVIHINNASKYPSPLSEADALKQISQSKVVYEAFDGLKRANVNPELNNYFVQALQTVKPYHNLLDINGNFSFFLKDNYLDDNRVIQYYQNPSLLKSAYIATGLYNLEEERGIYEKSIIERLKTESLRSSNKMNKYMASVLLQLEAIRGEEVYYEQSLQVKKLNQLIYEAYERMGYDKLEQLKFNKKAIEKELLILDIQEQKNAYPLINLIKKSFKLNRTYLVSDVKIKLQELYDELGIKARAKSVDIEMYFHFNSYNKYENKKSNRAYILTESKTNCVLV